MASTGTGLACALLCSGLSWAANPCGSPQGDGAGAQQSQVDWELPAIDAEVAGRLARMCEESRRGSSRAVQEQVLGLQQRPERLALCLATTLEHGAWRVPGDGGEPVSTWRVTGEREALLLELASGLPATLVVERARLALAAEVTPRQRRAELMLLGQVARPQDVPLIFDLAQACDMLRARGDWTKDSQSRLP